MIYRPLRYEQMMRVAERYDVRARRMFNGMGVYSGEKMFAFLIGDDIGLKLAPTDFQEALTIEGADVLRTESGEPMPQYVRMPKSVLDDESQFAAWVEKSAEYAQMKRLE